MGYVPTTVRGCLVLLAQMLWWKLRTAVAKVVVKVVGKR